MIHVITSPDVSRGQPTRDGPSRTLSFMCGGLIGGALTGAAIGGAAGLMSEQVRAAATLALGVAVLGLALLEAVGKRPVLLQRNTETPYAWVHGSPLIGPLLTGGLLGTAIGTRVGFAIVYLPLLVALASGSAMVGALVGGAYAAARVAGAGGVVLMALVARREVHGRTSDPLVTRLLNAGAAARVVSGIATTTFLLISAAQYW
jgi:hypothetical protein